MTEKCLENKQKSGKEVEIFPDQLYSHAVRAMRILLDAGFEARLAGGCVRDRLLGRRPKDYDIASQALPEEVSTIFKQKGLKVVPTGIEHGTVTVVMAGQPIEITSLRKDVATDGRRAVVAFSHSFEEDAARRDFTINALYEDIDGKVHDYFSGQADLKAGILRFVGHPEQRVREDYLRILRLFRFWARYGFAPATGTLPILETERRGLDLISQERKTSELLQTLSERTVRPVLEAMQLLHIHEQLGFEALSLDQMSLLEGLPSGLARLALLFRGQGDEKTFRSRFGRLRLSKQQEDWAVLLFWPGADPGPDPLDQMEALDAIEASLLAGKRLDEGIFELWEKLGTFEKAQVSDLRAAAFHPRRHQKLPLDGRLLIQNLGMKPGPDLGEAIRLARRSFRAGLWTSTEEGLDWCQRQGQTFGK